MEGVIFTLSSSRLLTDKKKSYFHTRKAFLIVNTIVALSAAQSDSAQFVIA